MVKQRPSYRAAIRWMIENDDTEFLNDDDIKISVTAAFTADMFGVDDQKVIKDLIREMGKRKDATW